MRQGFWSGNGIRHMPVDDEGVAEGTVAQLVDETLIFAAPCTLLAAGDGAVAGCGGRR
jgi:hypothetical protein